MNGVIDNNNNVRKISRPEANSELELNRENLALKQKNAYANQRYMTSDDFVTHFQRGRSNADVTSPTGSGTGNQSRQPMMNTSTRAQGVRQSAGVNRPDATSYRRATSNQQNASTSHTQVIEGNVYIPKNIQNYAQQRQRQIQSQNVKQETAPRGYAASSGTVSDTSSTIRVKSIYNGESIQNARKFSLSEQNDNSQSKNDSKVKQFFRSLSKKWNTPEYREHQDTSKTRVLPLTIVMAAFTIIVSLMLIVGSSVLLNTASNQVSQLSYEVSQLEKESAELQSKLELKNELANLDQLAVEYGMIDKNYATVKYIKIDNIEKITNYEEENDENINLASLLSAFGFKLK